MSTFDAVCLFHILLDSELANEKVFEDLGFCIDENIQGYSFRTLK